MKYLSLLLFVLILFSCSEKSITEPEQETSEAIYCEWITINGEYGFGDGIWVTPTGVNVLQVAAIKYEPDSLLITSIGVTGNFRYTYISESDIIEYELDDDEENDF